MLDQVAREGLRQTLATFVPRVQQVMRQTRARIFGGDTHVEDNVLSLFEPSTEVIRKGKASKPNEFGKLVKLQEAEHQIITGYVVYAKRPSDADLLTPSVEAHAQIFGRAPRLVAGDAGFYSAKNEAAALRKRRETSLRAESIDEGPEPSPPPEETLVSKGSAVAHRL